MFKRIGLAVIGTLILAGCSATELKPGADRIIVSHNPPPKGCKFLGALVGDQGGAFSGKWTSNKDLAQGAMNDMRNKALDLGANFVQLQTDRAGVTGSGTWYAQNQQETDVTTTGNAYKCNPTDIGL